jgi:hypothetical protein
VDVGRRATAVEGGFSSGAAFLGRGTGGRSPTVNGGPAAMDGANAAVEVEG